MHLVGLALHVGLQGTEPLIGEHKAGQVPGVGVRGLQDGPQLLLEAEETQGAAMSAGPTASRAFTHWACKPEPAGRLIQPQASSFQVLRAALPLDSMSPPQRGLV